MEKIDISICCATFNQEEYISDTIDSFLMQDVGGLKVEIIIHDDCSTDGTVSILKNYEKNNSNIKLILQSENRYSKGLKIIPELIKRSKGKYIAFCEGDDYWTDSHKLLKQFQYMEENDNCTLCSHAAIMETKEGNYVDDYCFQDNNKIFHLAEVVKNGGNFLPTHSLFYRRKSVLSLPKAYYECPVGDYPLQIFLTELGYCYHINDKMGVYRVNAKGSVTDDLYETIDSTTKLIEALNIMLNTFKNDYNHKYDGLFQETIDENTLKIYEIRGDIKNLRKSPYKELFNKKSIRYKTIIIFKCYFPKVYWRLRKYVK